MGGRRDCFSSLLSKFSPRIIFYFIVFLSAQLSVIDSYSACICLCVCMFTCVYMCVWGRGGGEYGVRARAHQCVHTWILHLCKLQRHSVSLLSRFEAKYEVARVYNFITCHPACYGGLGCVGWKDLPATTESHMLAVAGIVGVISVSSIAARFSTPSSTAVPLRRNRRWGGHPLGHPSDPVSTGGGSGSYQAHVSPTRNVGTWYLYDK